MIKKNIDNIKKSISNSALSFLTASAQWVCSPRYHSDHSEWDNETLRITVVTAGTLIPVTPISMRMRGSRPVTRHWAALYICQNIPWLWLFVTRSSHQARVDHPMVRAQLRAVSPRISAACVTSTRRSQVCSSVKLVRALRSSEDTHWDGASERDLHYQVNFLPAHLYW